MGDASTQLDVTTLLIGLAVIVFAVSLAQLVILIISGYLKRKRQHPPTRTSKDSGRNSL